MLKCTSVKLELLTNADMLLLVEKGIRGGVSQYSNRYAHANNRYMPDFGSSKEESYLIYFNVNNLYGVAMIQHLLVSSFEWEHKPIDVTSLPDEASEGYIFKADLEYPQELRETNKDLPLCQEHCIPANNENSKLMSTLLPKTQYKIHSQSLKPGNEVEKN